MFGSAKVFLVPLAVCIGTAATVVCAPTGGPHDPSARGAEPPPAQAVVEGGAQDNSAGEGKTREGNAGGSEAYDRKSDDSKSYDRKSGDSKAGDSKAGESYDSKSEPMTDAPQGADAAPVARRDDLGPPDQEQPRHVIAAYIAAADASDRQRAFALMTPACAERERSWEKSFSKAIFDRGYRFHVVSLGEEQVDEESAYVRLRVVFLHRTGEPDNEGMSFSLVRLEGRWWLDEIH